MMRRRDSCNGNTPLHLAAMDGRNLKIVKLLVWNGADLHAKNDEGLNPYEYVMKLNLELESEC